MNELVLPRSEAGEHARGTQLLSDELLAKLVGRGSAHAFGVLYERHHQALYRYCRSILRNEHDAQDALQSTMTQAYAALRAKERDVSLRAWLFRIAHNESITILRRGARELDLNERSASANDEPAAILEARARLSQLVADLLELPERQRGALLMRELSGLHIQEIAGALAISPAAAKQALFEARNSLRALSEGREMDCEKVRLAISAHDRRVLRGRRIRAHLKACESCSDFQAAIGAREADLRSLTPVLPAPAATAILARLLGGGSWGGSAGGGGAGAVAGSGQGLLAHAGGSLLVKAAAGATIMAVATAGTVHFTTASTPRPSGQTAPFAARTHPGASGLARKAADTQASVHGAANTTGSGQRPPASRPNNPVGGGSAAAALAGVSGHGRQSRGPTARAEGRSGGHANRHTEKAAHGNERERRGSAPQSRAKGPSKHSETRRAGKPTTAVPTDKSGHSDEPGASPPEGHAPPPVSSQADTGQSGKRSAAFSEGS